MTEQLYLAKKDYRLINQLIDLFFIFLIWFAVIALIIYFRGYRRNTNIDKEMSFIYFLFFPIFWMYYLVLEFFIQKTIGKMITRTKVVTVTGEKPTFIQILIRTLSRCIPFEYLAYLFSVIGLHDRLSSTRVIND
jgi:uncharacterized RDD family membrane protein YckC